MPAIPGLFGNTAGIGGGAATPSGTGIPHIVGGVQNAAASLIVDADVNAAAAIAGTKISPSFGAQAVITTSTLSVKANPASAGDVRLGAGAVCKGRDASNSFDVQFLSVGVAGGNIICGDSVNGSSYIIAPLTGVYMRCGGSVDVCTFVAANLLMAKPIIGDSTYTSPYGVHGKVAVATAAPFTMSAANIAFDTIRLTEDTTGTITFARPASDAGAYTKFVGNASALGTKTITTGAGAAIALLPNTGAEIEFDNTVGCVLKSAALAFT